MRARGRSFIVAATMILAVSVLAAVANGSTRDGGAASEPPLTGLSFSLTMLFAHPGPSASFEGCPGIDASTEFPGLSGSTGFAQSPWAPTVAVLSTPSGWAYDSDPSLSSKFPTELDLVWNNPSSAGDLSALGLIEMRLPVTVNGSAPSWVSIATSTTRRLCPGQLSTEQSPIGQAYPVVWAAGIPAEKGCGYVSLASTGSSVAARFLATSVAGYFSDTLPGFACRGGQAVVEAPSTLPSSFAVDQIASKAASVVARKSVRISCTSSLEDWDKVFDVPGNTAVIVGGSDGWIEGECAYIDRASKLRPSVRDSAILTVGELAEHLKGIADDNAAECAAARSLPVAAAALGVPKSGLKEVAAYARRLLRTPALGC